MKKTSVTFCLFTALLTTLLLSCKKDGLNSPMAKKIQYKWERTSRSSSTDYLDGRAVTWSTTPAQPGNFLQFDNDGYFYANYGSFTSKYQYKVDGEKILSLAAASSRPTTPQYTDTTYIKQADDHLLVLYSRSYYISGAYSQLNQYLDSLKR